MAIDVRTRGAQTGMQKSQTSLNAADMVCVSLVNVFAPLAGVHFKAVQLICATKKRALSIAVNMACAKVVNACVRMAGKDLLVESRSA